MSQLSIVCSVWSDGYILGIDISSVFNGGSSAPLVHQFDVPVLHYFCIERRYEVAKRRDAMLKRHDE